MPGSAPFAANLTIINNPPLRSSARCASFVPRMNQALKRLGFLLQLWLLGFGLTVHALALGPADLSPASLYQRIAQTDDFQADFFDHRPDRITPADYPTKTSQPSELAPFEMEEEEEAHATGAYFKHIPTTGGATSAYLSALPDIPKGFDPGRLREDPPVVAGESAIRKHILFQVYRI